MARGLFLCKISRPYIHPTVAVVCTIVKYTNQRDWNKLLRISSRNSGILSRIKGRQKNCLKWYVEVSLGVHSDFKLHTRATLTMRKGSIVSMSRKQKLNIKSGMEAELVGSDDASSLILWTNIFLEAQGYKVKQKYISIY